MNCSSLASSNSSLLIFVSSIIHRRNPRVINSPHAEAIALVRLATCKRSRLLQTPSPGVN